MRKVPHTYVIIFALIVISAFATWVIPGGEYREIVKEVDGSQITTVEYHRVEGQAQTWQVFAALFKGFVRQSGIIVFILMIGGAFWILNTSRAIDAGIFSFLRSAKKLEHNKLLKRIGIENLIMTFIMLIFSVFGAVFGMSEETIAFIIILVPLAISMGYDSITGVCLVFVAAGLGFAGAVLNPFTIGIAQGISGLDLFSGWEYRIVCWVIINAVGIAFILRYARKVKRDPKRSIVYEEDEYWREKGAGEIEKLEDGTPRIAWITFLVILIMLLIAAFEFPMTDIAIGEGNPVRLPAIPIATALFAVSSFFSLRRSVQFFILNLLGMTILFLIIGVMGYQWYIMEIATLFFAMGLFAGVALGKSPNEITKLFLEGAKDIMSAALVVGLAGGIIVILEDGKVIDTILYSMASTMKGVGEMASVGIMYFIQTGINLFMPSGSAKAALTMPIMAPFSDLIGVSRQATVMAYQFGDGFTNMITPTSGVLIAVLGVARIPYEKWVRWVWPLMVILILLGLLLLIPTVRLDLNGF